ncbi:hypothetical protein JOE64_001965 [Microbacterium dextranolyticum]|uniref:Uncharacterized protein n=1 Tax=Microbacterium dextranolyticum TaxID=36806 RepID=A0A9W6M6C4_9MICO|nr:hypothetical protein [Microbacterium dextranolyticum]GLJ95403.1 hypothetical protein GCM10017591_14660 [Microbacterium dextranolyticum]
MSLRTRIRKWCARRRTRAPYIPPEGRFTGSVLTQLPALRGPSLWGGKKGGMADVMQPANLSGNFSPTYPTPDDPRLR